MSNQQAEFLECFEASAARLHAWARLHIHPPLRRQMDPEDLVQEVCLRACRGFDSFNGDRGTFPGWLFGIARHVLIDAVRRMRGRGDSIFAADEEGRRGFDVLAKEATGISTRVVREEDVQTFLQVLDELDAEDQRLMLYRGIEGRSHSEVAALLEISLEASEKRWQRLQQEVARRGAAKGLDRLT